MTPAERNMLDTFLQYGDHFSNSKIIFMGKEEGLGQHLETAAIPARMSLLTDPAYLSSRGYVNGINHTQGWYITDGGCLGRALGDSPDTPSDFVQVISFQAYFYWLLQDDNRLIAKSRLGYDWKQYYSMFNTLGSGSHMIDYYPFPKISSSVIWSYYYQTEFPTSKKYYGFYCHDRFGTNNRWKILRNLFNNFPMEITISYIGYVNGNFLNQSFYTNLGFIFGKKMTTKNVNPSYAAYIDPSPKPIDFIIGDRVQNGKKQIVVQTPFFTRRQPKPMKYEDIAVISSWLP